MAAAQQELLIAELMDRGCLGCEIRDVTTRAMPAARGISGPSASSADTLVSAYFAFEEMPFELDDDFPAPSGSTGQGAPSWQRALARFGVEARLVGDRALEDQDWMAHYRELSKPFLVGRRFLVDPRDPDAGETTVAVEVMATGERLCLRLPARRAFGTGLHPTTALVLELLEELSLPAGSVGAEPLGGSTVLDVGCGTGVLAIAAMGLGAASVTALDIDPIAVFHARENARLNSSRLTLLAGGVGSLSLSARFDLLLVNVLPENLRGGEGELVRRLAGNGRMIVSGLLGELEDEIRELYRRLGLDLISRRQSEEWVALVLGRRVTANKG